MCNHNGCLRHEPLHPLRWNELRVLAVGRLVGGVAGLLENRLLDSAVSDQVVNGLNQTIELLFVGTHSDENHLLAAP